MNLALGLRLTNLADEKRFAAIELDELTALPIPEASGRRFLVLNACDSGASAVHGGLAGFGLASALSSSAQAVVGHLWPVHEVAATIFAALLANELAGRRSFVDAFAAALRSHVQHAGNAAAALAKVGAVAQPIVELAGHTIEDLSNFVRLATPTLFV